MAVRRSGAGCVAWSWTYWYAGVRTTRRTQGERGGEGAPCRVLREGRDERKRGAAEHSRRVILEALNEELGRQARAPDAPRPIDANFDTPARGDLDHW